MKKILIADDDESIANLLVNTLEAEGYEAYKVTQALRFFDAVREHQPDLILLDLMMPYLEGDDELRLMQMAPDMRDIPVIIVTAKHEAKQQEPHYRQLGVVTVVVKPFDINHLTQLIAKTIGPA